MTGEQDYLPRETKRTSPSPYDPRVTWFISIVGVIALAFVTVVFLPTIRDYLASGGAQSARDASDRATKVDAELDKMREVMHANQAAIAQLAAVVDKQASRNESKFESIDKSFDSFTAMIKTVRLEIKDQRQRIDSIMLRRNSSLVIPPYRPDSLYVTRRMLVMAISIVTHLERIQYALANQDSEDKKEKENNDVGSKLQARFHYGDDGYRWCERLGIAELGRTGGVRRAGRVPDHSFAARIRSDQRFPIDRGYHHPEPGRG